MEWTRSHSHSGKTFPAQAANETREILWTKIGWGSEEESEDEVLDLTKLDGDEEEESGVTSGGDSGLWIDNPLAQPE